MRVFDWRRTSTTSVDLRLTTGIVPSLALSGGYAGAAGTVDHGAPPLAHRDGNWMTPSWVSRCKFIWPSVTISVWSPGRRFALTRSLLNRLARAPNAGFLRDVCRTDNRQDRRRHTSLRFSAASISSAQSLRCTEPDPHVLGIVLLCRTFRASPTLLVIPFPLSVRAARPDNSARRCDERQFQFEDYRQIRS